MRHKATAKNVSDVLRRFADFLDECHPRNRKDVAICVNEMLDDYAADDFFGTEGQCDPRGDQRE